ncbi:hypothetical protein ACLMJK_000214 [Lecanora helva]
MFRNRKNSQKPTDELYAAFKQNFPHLGRGTASIATSADTAAAAAAAAVVTSTESIAPLTSTTIPQGMDQRHFGDHEGSKDQDIGLGESDNWRMTPSMLDTDSYAFASFANQQSHAFTPTMGINLGGIVHNQAGDLHTPGIGFGLGTPLSLSNSEDHPNSASAIDMQGFHPHLLHSQPFQHANTFMQPQSFAPSSFVHHDSAYGTMQDVPNGLPNGNVVGVYERPEFAGYSVESYDDGSAHAMDSMDKLRYQVTLNAPTAMVKHHDEIPITYLNKGQAYVVTINDSTGLGPAQGLIKYRTVVRISFEDEEQRQRPSACWQLWREGRGLAEAHQRNGRLQAVEYVDPNQGSSEDPKRPRVELEKASFDCFSVTWSPAPGSAAAACSVAVRFNFLSTDFSHSKGVKGIPVRLCAKTEVVSSGTPDSPPGPTSEVSFCKVKLFRDHGAERKLSNDIAHIKKTIDKLKQQITQLENGVKEVGKRKRSGGDKNGSNRPGKVQKHKRTWSVSSQGSSGRPAVEEDLHVKLGTMQDMFTSTRPVSVLYLKGYEQDDPDIYPVSLPGEPTDLTKTAHLRRTSSWEQKTLSESANTDSCFVSPTPSSTSASSDKKLSKQSSVQKPTPPTATDNLPPNDWQRVSHLKSENAQGFRDASVKIPKANLDGSLTDWIDAFDVDPSYKPPPGRIIKPVACFYVLSRVPGNAPGEDYYRAVYLMERTVQHLISSIATRCGVEPTQVARIVRINSKGLKIIVDDEVIQELPEGQDMTVEFETVDTNAEPKNEPLSGGSTPTTETFNKNTSTQWLEMRLLF